MIPNRQPAPTVTLPISAVWRQLVLLLLIAGSCTTAQADDAERVQVWLDRMALAVNNLTYRGTLVYVRGDQLETMRIYHRVEEGETQERMVALSGPQREVIRDQDRVRCIFPDQQSVIVDSRITEPWFPVIPPEQAANPSARYVFKVGGTERIAGLAAQVVHIRPKDGFRYGYRLWLERNTGMLLKSALLDASDNALEQLMFTDIEIGAGISEADLEPQIADEGFVQVEFPKAEPTGSAAPTSDWQVADLPAGFMLSGHHHGSKKAGSMEHLVFTDGLASVSVYVESIEDGSLVLDGPSRLGAINMFGAVHDGFAVTAVGEVPPPTVEKMANSVRLNP